MMTSYALTPADFKIGIAGGTVRLAFIRFDLSERYMPSADNREGYDRRQYCVRR